MKYRNLGRTDLKVSEICLGTMTWGSQNTEQEAHDQIDYAREHGVDFIDTAELYPTTPLSEDTQGDTERYLGSWLNKSGQRDRVIVATKITGNGNRWIRDGAGITPETLENALENSLRRLQTDYVDLYQLHWPNRGSYHFRNYWGYEPTGSKTPDVQSNLHAVLEKLQSFVEQGKIRHVGLSNETCWGTSQFLKLSETRDLPRMVSIQNEYSLMCRIFDADLAELSHHENVGLLAYSPLAAGMLSGKYHANKVPDASRRSILDTLHQRYSDRSQAVVDQYAEIARAHNLDLSQMSLAFCLSRPFTASVIIGATHLDQLATNIGASDVALNEDVLTEIAKVYRENAMPF
ncbi:MAG: aldo/keto reductase [Hyphomicrobiaceae bacterium]